MAITITERPLQNKLVIVELKDLNGETTYRFGLELKTPLDPDESQHIPIHIFGVLEGNHPLLTFVHESELEERKKFWREKAQR